MEKRRLVVSYKNLTEELKEQLSHQYPYGYGGHLIKVNKSDHEYFYAVPFETEDTKYLVKIDVKIDLNHDEDEEEEPFTDDTILPEAPEDLDGEDDYDDDYDNDIPDADDDDSDEEDEEEN
ncbi:MAG TPA: hypothetical protein ENN63_00470 [Bacteroidetes bacterium]|nr:hypothetical protein [Bacteroidota bacterium]